MELPTGEQHRLKAEEFRRRHRLALLTLLFTDIVGSVQLKQTLGDTRAVMLIQQHHTALREILKTFPEGEEIETAGDSFFVVFTKPSDGARFALRLQHRLRELAEESGHAVKDRIGIHVGEVFIKENDGAGKAKDLYGLQVDTTARIMSLGGADQILLSRAAFDNARQVLKGEELSGIGPLDWHNHGPYVMKGVEDPLEICEVGERGLAALKPPADSEKAHRHVSADGEPVLGWRPAVGVVVPNSAWRLEEKLGEGGMGEVWLAKHGTLKETRVFKFCFRADHVRTLKREVTLFKVLKERVGRHPHVVGLHDVLFDAPPFYLVTDYAPGRDLVVWCEAHGGIPSVPLEARLEIVAQVADALQAAQDAGIVHRDVKPPNILLKDPRMPKGGEKVHAMLSDFGIGQVLSEEALSGITKGGFTVTVMSESSSYRAGTQLYMPPEMAAGKPAGARSDLYSLGVVLFQLLVGDFSRPVTTDWQRHVADPLLRADLERCFAGDPQERFAGAGELARRLRALPARREQRAAEEKAQKERERAAYRRGVVRTCTLAAGAVMMFAGLSWFAFKQSQSARHSQAVAEEALGFVQLQLADDELARGEIREGIARLAHAARQPYHRDIMATKLVDELLYRLHPADRSATVQLIGHEAGVQFARFSPDGRKVVTTSADGTARVWDASSGKILSPPLRHAKPVVCAAFSPDGKWIATASEDMTAVVWDAGTGKPIGEPLIHAEEVTGIEFSPDGKEVATASMDKTARIWEAATGKLVATLHHDGPVLGAAFSPDGSRVITASEDKTARVWDAKTGAAICGPLTHKEHVTCASFSPDGRYVVTASEDNTARVWNSTTGEPVGEPIRHEGDVHAASFSPDGGRIVTASHDDTVRVWEAATGKPLTPPIRHEGDVLFACFSPDGQRIVSASADKTARVWDAATGKPYTEPLRHEEMVNFACFDPSGRHVVTASADKTAAVWDVATGKPFTEPFRHNGDVNSAMFSPDGKEVVTASADGTARVWKTSNGFMAKDSVKHADAINWASFSPDGRKLVTASSDGAARVWEVESGKAASAPLKHGAAVNHAEFSPDGRQVVSASDDKSARIWDANTGAPQAEPLYHMGSVLFAAFSPDGQRVVTVSADRTARIWDAATGKPVGEALRHAGTVLFAAFSPDSRSVVTASADKTARIWDATTGLSSQPLMRHDDDVNTARFSPDGSKVVTASADQTARIWDAKTSKPLTESLRHDESVLDAAFSPDGMRVITASADRSARVWDARTGKPLTEPLLQSEPVTAAAFSPDGQRIVVASQDNTARIWDVPAQAGLMGSDGEIIDVLANYAEALVRLREVSSGYFQPVSAEARSVIATNRGLLKASPSPLARVILWFGSDPLSRTISPFSDLSVSNYVTRRIEEDTAESLREALLLDPTNALVTARFALRLAEQKGTNNIRSIGEAEFLSRRAAQLAPGDADVMRLRERVQKMLSSSGAQAGAVGSH